MYINELTQEKGLQHNLGQLWEKEVSFIPWAGLFLALLQSFMTLNTFTTIKTHKHLISPYSVIPRSNL